MIAAGDELEGSACYAGLNPSSTSDLTAMVLVFPPGDSMPDNKTGRPCRYPGCPGFCEQG